MAETKESNTVWVIRAGKNGENEAAFIERNAAAIGFDLATSIGKFKDRRALRSHLGRNKAADQLWSFYRMVTPGDMVVLPRKVTREVAVGRIAGAYSFQPDRVGRDVPHTRPVTWLATNIPRADFDQELLYSFGGLGTVYRSKAPNAKQRIERIAKSYLGDPVDERLDSGEPSELDPHEEVDDLDQAIKDRIVARLRQKFAGPRLEYLVACVLRASDYVALETRAGPDGGVDIVAGRGDLGFGQPRLCVQVKARTGKVDLAEYDRLIGNVKTFRAEHGLLVSLGGFTKPVLDRNEQSFFEVRLWGPEELTERLLDTYESLPAAVQADIPLRNRKVLEEVGA